MTVGGAMAPTRIGCGCGGKSPVTTGAAPGAIGVVVVVG